MQREERGLLGFYARSAAHRIGTRRRSTAGRERVYRIGDHEATLPPGHKLPWFQAAFPTHDRYGNSGRIMCVVDSTGRSMFTVPAEAAPTVLQGLTSWLQRSAVPGDTAYLDVWLVDPSLAHDDPDSGE